MQNTMHPFYTKLLFSGSVMGELLHFIDVYPASNHFFYIILKTVNTTQV